MLSSITIVGPGRMGLALGTAFTRMEAVRRLSIFGRRPEPPSHPLFTEGDARYVFGVETLSLDTEALFLAVPDAVVPEMARVVAAQGPAPTGCAAFHLSGALPTDVLEPLRARGYEVGSFHPLQAIGDPVRGADRIPGSYIAVLGSPEATAIARRLAGALGSPVITVPASRRPLFHAATVMGSNYLPPLLDLAARLMERAGVTSDEALPALIPLVRGTLASIEERGLEASVRGPIASGDVETVALHLRALDAEDHELYTLFGKELVRLAESSLDPDVRQALESQFEMSR